MKEKRVGAGCGVLGFGSCRACARHGRVCARPDSGNFLTFLKITMNQTSQSLTLRRFSTPPLTGRLRVAFIAASWHTDIVQQGEAGFLAELQRLHPSGAQADIHTVPGALEIPLHALNLARSGRYDAIVACAFVVDGGIYRHEFVAATVLDGLMRVQLDTGVPVLSMVLTPKTYQEQEDQTAFFAAHFVKKGEEAARACVQTVAGLRSLATND